MTVFRSYFSKNNTILENSLINSSKNPVTEISYGGLEGTVSRFIFDINFEPLLKRIEEKQINPQRIVKHVLKLTNTIRYTPERIGGKSYDSSLNRASGFKLQLFNINEEWDAGTGYDFNFSNQFSANQIDMPSNWKYRKNPDIEWASEGAFISGQTQIIGEQYFETGAEDIEIDITEYVNSRLFSPVVTGTTGTTGFTASQGLGLKFHDVFENLITEFRNVVSFHTKHTNTFYEPFVETHIDNLIQDDRNFFYQDKLNSLFLYSKTGNYPIKDNFLDINKVTIRNHKDEIYHVFTGDSITKFCGGVFKVDLRIDSDEYPDSIIFKDEWEVVVDGETKPIKHVDYFYLIDREKYYRLNSEYVEFDNYNFYLWGIHDNEKIVAGDVKRIKITVKELYANQNHNKPLNVDYRVFTTVGENYELDIIPYTAVNRTKFSCEFNLDTIWMLPQDYFLQIRMRDGNYHEAKETIRFTIVSNKIK